MTVVILAIDCTAREAAAAVCDGERCLADFAAGDALSGSEAVLPMLEAALAASGVSLDGVELLAVAAGPGSFTGVRIGVSLIKGLGFGRQIPVAAVDTLEALAENLMPLCGLIVPVMDARRGEVYAACFAHRGDSVLRRLTEDRGISPAALAEELIALAPDSPVYLVGDGVRAAEQTLREAGVALAPIPDSLRRHSAASVARVALRMAERGETTTPAALRPIYLRPAEVQVSRTSGEVCPLGK